VALVIPEFKCRTKFWNSGSWCEAVIVVLQGLMGSQVELVPGVWQGMWQVRNWSMFVSKVTWVLQDITQAIDARYGNDTVKYLVKLILPDPLETRPNRSLTLLSLTTSLAKVLHTPNRRTLTQALPRARLHFQTEEVHHSRPFLETRERWKANSPGETAPSWQQTLPLLCTSGHVSKDCPKSTSASSKA